jgi:hypothetical protein
MTSGLHFLPILRRDIPAPGLNRTAPVTPLPADVATKDASLTLQDVAAAITMDAAGVNRPPSSSE